MSQLQDNLTEILRQKNAYLLPENLKSGVELLGVTGTLVGLNGETKTVTPTTSQQTIVPTGTGKNALTEVTVEAVTAAIDASITSGNIKSGVTILGVSGSSSVVNTNDANATAADIAQGKTAYVDGVKITGTAVAEHDSVKLFVSTTAMNNDNDKALGDIAIVYDNNVLTGLYVVTTVSNVLTYTPLPTQLSAITSGDVYLNKVVMGADNTIVTGTIPVTATEVDTAVDTTEEILGDTEPAIQDHYEIIYES
jgi:hypothetical protein